MCIVLDNPDQSSQDIGFAPNLRGQISQSLLFAFVRYCLDLFR